MSNAKIYVKKLKKEMAEANLAKSLFMCPFCGRKIKKRFASQHYNLVHANEMSYDQYISKCVFGDYNEDE